MPLDSNDFTRIFEYGAFELPSEPEADGIYTTGDVLDLLEIQISEINDEDAERGTNIGDRIKANLDRLDTLDGQRFNAAGQGGIKILGIGSGIEYFKKGATQGFSDEFTFIRYRIARMLSLSYSAAQNQGVSMAYRG